MILISYSGGSTKLSLVIPGAVQRTNPGTGEVENAGAHCRDPESSVFVSCSHAPRGNTDLLDRYPGMRSYAERGNEKDEKFSARVGVTSGHD